MAYHNIFSLTKRSVILNMQKAIAQLFDVDVPALSKLLNNIFSEGELQPEATVSKMEIAELINHREFLGSCQ